MSKGKRCPTTRNVNKTKTMDKKTSEYHIWWVFVLTDRLSTASRKRLEARGFSSSAFSKSLKRHCPSLQKAKEMQAEVQICLRKGDLVETLLITDKQFGMMTTAFGH